MKSSEKVLLDKFNQIIETNFHNPDFGIEEICHELGTSRSQLYRHIKEQTHLSTSLYIRQRKLIKAKDLLESSEMKTAEIAYLLGIDSPQNFSKYFTQEFGLTPTAYRKMVSEVKNISETRPPREEKPHLKQLNGHKIEQDSITSPVIEIKGPFTRRKYLYAGIALIVCLVTALYVWKSLGNKAADSPLIPAFSGNSVAILPFKNLGTPETAYFSDGIMDQLHGSLSRIDKLKVISTTSSGKYRNSLKLIPQIANELNVNYILEGSVFQADSKIRINVELVRADDDRTIWTKSYDGDTKDVFSYLNNVAGEVAHELDQKLSNADREKLGKVPTSNPEAYKAYLQGSQLIVTRKKEQLEESIVKLNTAIQLDPEFAAAYASRGQAYHLMAESGFMDAAICLKSTEQNSLTAIRLDAENGLAYANLANIYRNQYKWEQAKTAYEIALKYNPNDAQINYWFSLLLRSTGNLREAITYSSKAAVLDPLHHVISGGNILNYLFAGDLGQAKKNLEEGQVLFNDSWVYFWTKGAYFGAIKDYKQALTCYAKAEELNPGIKSVRYQTFYFKALDGQVDEVNRFLKELPGTSDNDISRAFVYAGLKDKKQSMFYLQKAADAGIIPTDLKVSPYLALIRNEPEYKRILAKFGL